MIRLAGFKRAFGFGGAQVAVRLVFGFASIKVTAVYLGPAGLALVAQLGSFISMCQGFLANGAGTAVVRLSSEYGQDPERLRSLLGSAGRLALMLALAAVVIISIASPWVAQWLFTDSAYIWAIVAGAFAIAASILNSVVLGALNGRKEIGLVVFSNVASTIVGFIIFVPACIQWGIAGGLIGSALAYVLALPVSVLLLRRSSHIRAADFLGPLVSQEVKKIAHFYPMLIAHSTLTPLGLILIRDVAGEHLGLEGAGIWQACWRLSEVYLMVVTTSVSLYLMPRLGEVIAAPESLRREVWRSLKIVAAITSSLALALFLVREWVVRLVFSSAFDGVAELMPWQLAGDVLRMAAWTLGFVLVALVRSVWYMALEIMVPLAYVAATAWLIGDYGTAGIPWAYCAAEGLHLVLGAFALRDVLFRRSSSKSES